MSLSIHSLLFLFHSAPVILAGSIAIECSSSFAKSFANLRDYRLGMDQILPDTQNTQNLAEDSLDLHPP
jgi:hypothetical protein